MFTSFSNSTLSANLFRLGSSVQKHAGSWGVRIIFFKKIRLKCMLKKYFGILKKRNLFLKIFQHLHISKKFSWDNFFFVLKSSEIYATKILPSALLARQTSSVIWYRITLQLMRGHCEPDPESNICCFAQAHHESNLLDLAASNDSRRGVAPAAMGTLKWISSFSIFDFICSK